MKFLLILISIFLGFSAICYFGLSLYVRDKIYESILKIPKNHVGIVLGTSKYLPNGGINAYFKYRINRAILLFKHKKINRIIVSGNGTFNYNEPKMMKNMLVKQGIPPEFICEDYSGFRTRDSILRAYKVFGQLQFTIISERYHAERALFIAYCEGLNPIAFTDSIPKVQLRIYIREIFARFRAIFDILFRTPPRVPGDKNILSI